MLYGGSLYPNAGPTGPQGPQGAQGVQGEQGEPGEPGADGADGGGAITLTGTTASIDASDATDLTVALPAGITRFFVVAARITRTAGASTSAAVRLFRTAARDDIFAMVFGNPFGGLTVSDTALDGPINNTGGNNSFAGIAGSSAAEFAYLSVYNTDFSEVGTFAVELTIQPIGA
jgi:hypothetical protein